MMPAWAVLSAGVVWGLAWMKRRLVVVTVTGGSMAPTLTDGERVLMRRTRIASVRVGQVVVLDRRSAEGGPGGGDPVRASNAGSLVTDGHWMIKRVAAVEGDPVPAEFLPPIQRRPVAGLDPNPGQRVPPRQLLVLGDNRARSHDSRSFGFVPGDDLLGVVVRRLPVPGRVAQPAEAPEDEAVRWSPGGRPGVWPAEHAATNMTDATRERLVGH